MNVLDSLFGTEVPLVAKMLIAFGVIFGLLALLWFVGRRFMPGPRVGMGGSRGRQPRLGVLDAHAVDARRKLVLIRRDNVEHLIMIGGPNDVVIESTILRGRPQVRPAQVSAPATSSTSAAPPERSPVPPERPATPAPAPAPPPERVQTAPVERPSSRPAERIAPAGQERPPAPARSAPVAPERVQAAGQERVQPARPAAASVPQPSGPTAPPARSSEVESASRLDSPGRQPGPAVATVSPPPLHPARPAWAASERKPEPARVDAPRSELVRVEAPRPEPARLEPARRDREEVGPLIDTAELEASLFAEDDEFSLEPSRREVPPASARPAQAEARPAPPSRSFADALLGRANPSPTKVAPLVPPPVPAHLEPRAADSRPTDIRPTEVVRPDLPASRAVDEPALELSATTPLHDEIDIIDLVPERLAPAAATAPARLEIEEPSLPPPPADLPTVAQPITTGGARPLGPMPTFTTRTRPEPAAAPPPPPPPPAPVPEPEPPSPEPPRPVSQDPFASLEEEMASLLGRIPGGSKP